MARSAPARRRVLNALDRGGLRAGESVIVSGHGPIGAAVVCLARASGAGRITVLEPSPARRQVALAMGATVAIDPGPADEPSDELRDSRGSADLGVDCSGAPGSLDALIRSTRSGARVVVPAVSRGATPVSMSQVVLGERSVIGSLGYQGDVARAITLTAEGRVDVTRFVSAVLPLSSVIDGFDAAGDALKILVDPTA